MCTWEWVRRRGVTLEVKSRCDVLEALSYVDVGYQNL